MGCASSKKRRCQTCQSNLSRSYSVPNYNSEVGNGDKNHFVALTSTTLGSLKLDSIDQIHLNRNSINGNHGDYQNNKNEMKNGEFEMEVNQAKKWSNMIDEKIPKVSPRTPIRTPPGEPETINSWELMAGLEDNSPLRVPNLLNRCFSYHGVTNSTSLDQPYEKQQDTNQPMPKLQENGSKSTQEMWVQVMNNGNANSNSNEVVKDFDPEIISTFRKALQELSPKRVGNLKSPENEKISSTCFFIKKGKDEEVRQKTCPPNGENKVVIYFTSLRGVRKTYEDCCQVRVILKGLGVRIDERDVSMHSGFKEEIRELIGEFRGGLPKVFVKGDYIGGVEEIKQLHEDGELENLFEGCDFDNGVCEACGDVRFVPCETCSGSCKIFYEEDEDDDDDDEREEEENGGEFHRCPDCNENGIVRCPVCCY